MRTKLLLTLIGLFIITSLNAQTLKVIYKEMFDLEEKFKDVKDPSWKKLLMDGAKRPNYYELINCKGESIFQPNKEEQDVEQSNVIILGGGGSNGIFYRNHNERTFINQTNFMSRQFLIKGNLEQPQWQITDKTLTIGKYRCTKAFTTKDSTQITAWFTADVPSNEGPKEFWGLPGLILKIETKLFTIEATKVSVTKELVEIEKPKKGKKITQADFDKMKKEKTEQMINKYR